MGRAVKEKPSQHVSISARDLKDIIRDELYGVGASHITRKGTIHPYDVRTVAKAIVNRALRSPR
jgi:hypothetical protein